MHQQNVWQPSWVPAKPIFMLMVPTLATDGDMGGKSSVLRVTALPRRDVWMISSSSQAS